MTFDDKAHDFVLKQRHREEDAMFDRFGVFSIQNGGHHVELYLDDLFWTKKRGQHRP